VYPETQRVPFTPPTVGVRTFQSPERYLFGECRTAGPDAGAHVCPVGVRKISGRISGCDCECHGELRTRLATRR
jgi:hypothetical protein